MSRVGVCVCVCMGGSYLKVREVQECKSVGVSQIHFHSL